MGGSGSVRSSPQTVSDYTLRQWFPNTQQSRSQPVGASKISFFTFHFWHNSFTLDDTKLAELSNNSFEWKNVIFWGSNILWPLLHIFRGQDPQPQDLRPWPPSVTFRPSDLHTWLSTQDSRPHMLCPMINENIVLLMKTYHSLLQTTIDGQRHARRLFNLKTAYWLNKKTLTH